MIDEYVDKGKVAACTAWGWVVGLMLGAWAVMVLGEGDAWKYAGMLAASSCALSAYAAVLHLRCYAVRLAGLVRSINSVHHEDAPAPVRRL